jgi:PAS domain S-box-containing protein
MHEEAPLSTAVIESLILQVNRLQGQLVELQQEKADLEVMLETVTGHSDQLVTEIRQEKQDLELLLETTAEHSDVIAADLHTQAVKAKQQVEEQFRLIAESTPVGLIISRIGDGQILYANEAMGAILGLEAQALLQRQTPDFYRHTAHRQIILQALLEQQSFQGELQCLRADRTPFWALVCLRPFVFKEEAAMLMATTDITDRKQAEEALRLAEERYRGIFENALEGIFQASPEGQYLSVNPAMARIYGYDSPAELMQHIGNLLEKPYVEAETSLVFRDQLFRTDQAKDFEYRCYRKNGEIIWIEEDTRAVRDSEGNILYYEGIVQEITQRKREEEALKQQVKQLQIEIDHRKREHEVKKIAQTDYFQNLMAEADSLRYSEDD